MGTCVNDSRIDQIVRCTEEIERCRKYSGAEGLPAFIGEMDWLSELHRLIHEQERESQ
jgi:hypothetical protein